MRFEYTTSIVYGCELCTTPCDCFPDDVLKVNVIRQVHDKKAFQYMHFILERSKI